jgi:hypothetical protein
VFEDIKWGISYNPLWDRTGMPESGYSKKNFALEEFFDAIDDGIDYVALYYNNGSKWESREIYKNGMPKPKRPNNSSILTISDGTKIIDKVKLKTKIVELYIPASVEEIAEAALYGAYNLEKVVFADNSNLKKIGNQAFAYCKNLTSINLPSSLEEIDYLAFKNCESLESINLPNNIKKMGASIFSGTNLTSIVVPPYVELDETFYKCKSLESVILSEGLETISQRVFYDCKNLKSVKLPNSLKKIGESAFAFCENLISINLPENLIDIGADAFYGTKLNLESVLAESFEKTFKDLQKEGLFENVKSFDLDFNGKGINIKLNKMA